MLNPGIEQERNASFDSGGGVQLIRHMRWICAGIALSDHHSMYMMIWKLK